MPLIMSKGTSMSIVSFAPPTTYLTASL